MKTAEIIRLYDKGWSSRQIALCWCTSDVNMTYETAYEVVTDVILKNQRMKVGAC